MVVLVFFELLSLLRVLSTSQGLRNSCSYGAEGGAVKA